METPPKTAGALAPPPPPPYADPKEKIELAPGFFPDMFTPTNLSQAMDVAKIIANSELAPKDYLYDKHGNPKKNPAATILAAVCMGARFGLDPFNAVQNIAVINGRPSMWGDAVLGVVMASGLLEKFEERKPDESLAAKEGWCRVKRKGDPEVIVRTFSLDEAARANLIKRSAGGEDAKGSGPWITYPGRMLQMRARSLGLRDKFPDVLKGLRIREEEDDQIRTAEYQVHGEGGRPQLSLRQPPGGGLGDGANVDKFIESTGGSGAQPPPSGGGGGGPRRERPAVDRTKLVKVRVIGNPTRGGSQENPYARVPIEPPTGGKLEPSAFFKDFPTIMEDAERAIKGSGFALVLLKQNGKYWNLEHFEVEGAAPAGEQDEPGAQG